MKLETENKTFAAATVETIIIGVQKHREQMKNWSAFSEFFGSTLEAWIRSGEISSDQKKLMKFPVTTVNETIKRVLFVGLGEGKTLTEENLRETFGLVGKQLKMLKINNYAIWLDSFNVAAYRHLCRAYEEQFDCAIYST